jgi:hypothetical protein
MGSRWSHYSLAFDSAEAMAPKSTVFINKLYASVDDDGAKREWNSEPERLCLKKFFIDSLSMTIAKQRVRDIRAMTRNFVLYILMKTHTIRRDLEIYM